MNNSNNCIFIEYCINCSQHSWCTKHDEKRYQQYFEMIKMELENEFEDFTVFGNTSRRSWRPIIPKLGSFEIVFREQLIFSKLKTTLWPASSKIIDKIYAIMEGREIYDYGLENQEWEPSERHNNSSVYDPNIRLKMAQTKRHDTSALMMQNNSSQKTVYPTRSRTVPKQREKEMEKLLPPITPNTKKLNAYDVPSGGSRDLSYRANSPGNQSIRIKSDPQSRARSNHKKNDPKYSSKEFGCQTDELPGIYHQAVTVKTQSRESERPNSRMNGESENKQQRVNIISVEGAKRKYFSDPENDIREDATEDMTQEIDSSNITNKFYTKTDGDENPSTIYNQKNTNTKSISSSDAPGDKRSIDQERNLKKKRTLDQAENTKQNGGYPHNYPGDVSGSEHSDHPLFDKKKQSKESIDRDTLEQPHSQIDVTELDFPENKISQISVSKEKVSKKKITVAASENAESVLRILTNTPEILNMKSDTLTTKPGEPTKIGLKFFYQNENEKEYTLYILRDREPWQKIIIQVRFE